MNINDTIPNPHVMKTKVMKKKFMFVLCCLIEANIVFNNTKLYNVSIHQYLNSFSI